MIFKSNEWLITSLFLIGNVVAEINTRNPNLLICISENHAASLLNSVEQFGVTINPTPNLNLIAQSGYSHQHAYCTNASEGNTAFSLLTGLSKNSELKNYVNSKFLGHYFKSIGYKTAFLGSWTWKDDPAHFGFEYWYTLTDPEIFFNPKIKDLHSSKIIEGHSTDIITDLAIRWLREKRMDKRPFLLLVSYPAMNRPWIPPVRMINHYNDEWFETPDNFFTDFNGRTPANRYQNMNIASDLDSTHDLFLEIKSDANMTVDRSSTLAKNMDSMNDEQRTAWALSWKPQNEAFARETLDLESLAIWKFQRFIKNYLRCLLAMDENIGRLVDFTQTLSEEGLHFVYTSERGRFTGEFGWFGSEWMYEQSARIPLILSNYNRENFFQIDPTRIFLDIDMYKLLKRMTHLGLLQKDDSISNFGKDEFYFINNKFPGESCVSPFEGFRKLRYKIINYYPFNEWEFYDLLTDPKEEKNLYYNHTHDNIINQYKNLLHASAEVLKSQYPKFEFSEIWKREQRSPSKKRR